MDLHAAEDMAISLMKQHKLTDDGYSPSHGWVFQFDRSKRRFGCCHYTRRIISLSKELTLLNDEEKVRDTILHEIAHALAPKGAGHGPVWRAMAKAIGCNGMRCYGSEVTTPKGKWKAVCTTCGQTAYYHRRPRNQRACGKCCRVYANGRWDSRFIFAISPLTDEQPDIA